MKRTTMALLLMFALTGCRLLQQSRHAAVNLFASGVVRTLFALQSGVPAGPSSRPLDRLAAPLAMQPSPRAAAAVVVASVPTAAPAIAAVAPIPSLPAPTSRYQNASLKPAARKMAATILLCRTRVRIDENGNVSM